MSKMKLTREQFVLLENCYLRHFPTHIPDEIFQDYKTYLSIKTLLDMQNLTSEF